jgi:hypothetical protein
MEKCGCLYCKRQGIPTTHMGWKGLKNRKGYMYGETKKVTKGGKAKQKRLK